MTSFILSEKEAEIVSSLVNTACEEGLVYDLLTAIESWQQNGQPEPDEMRFFELAAMAAGISRFKRENED